MFNFKYAFDRYGSSPDNFIVEEPHSVTAAGPQVVLVTNGLFYTKDFSVRLDNSAVPLVVGVDYEFIGQDSFIAAYGLENASAIQLLKPVTGTLLLTHRLVGGKEGLLNTFTEFLAKAIEKAAERNYSFKDIRNRPAAYPPERHSHVLADLQKWEDLNALLLQIRDAVIDTRSLGSSALALSNQDQRILKLISVMQSELSALTLRLKSFTDKMDKLQRFSMDGGDLKAGPPKFPEVTTFKMASVDLNDPYGKIDKDILLTPTLIYPKPGSRGVDKSPMLLGSRLFNGHGKVDKGGFRVYWIISDSSGHHVFQKRVDCAGGEVPSLDLKAEGVELAQGHTYRITLHYILESGLQRSSENVTLTITESRVENLTMDAAAAVDVSGFGESVSLTADGKVAAIGVKTYTGETKPSILLFNGETWRRFTLSLPVNSEAPGLASRVLIDPNGSWLLIGGAGQNFIRKYALSITYGDGFPTSVSVSEPTSILEPATTEPWTQGINMAVDRLGEVLVVATTGLNGSFHFYDILTGETKRLFSYNGLNLNLPIDYGGLGLGLTLSDRGGVVVASSPFAGSNEAGENKGGCLVFVRNGTQWEAGELFMEDSAENDALWGNHISLDRYGDFLYVSEQLHQGKGRGLYYSVDKAAKTLVGSEVVLSADGGVDHEFGAGAIDSEGRTLAIGGNTLAGNPGITFFRRLRNRWVPRNTIRPTSAVLPHVIALSTGGETLVVSSINLKLWSGVHGDSSMVILR